MKKLLAVASLLLFAGFGCASPGTPSPAATQTYANTEYGFSFAHPTNDEVRVREQENRADTYLGLPMDFFASLRDLHRAGETTPINLAYLYAAKDMTVPQFKQALEASGENVAVKSVEDVTVNGVKLVKTTSTTDMGTDKVHYLLDCGGTMIVFSVFISENANFDPILQTLKVM